MTSKTAYEFGAGYARSMAGQPGFDTIQKNENADIPVEDYLSMKREGIEANARLYWRGFNSVIKN